MVGEDDLEESFDTCIIRLSLDIGPRYGDGEPSEHTLQYSGDVLSGLGFEQRIGEISLSVVDFESAEASGCSKFDALDGVDSSLAHFCDLLSVRSGRFKAPVERLAGGYIERLLVFERLKIEPQYRGKGLGLCAMEIACAGLGGGCSLAVLKAFPTQWEGRVNESPETFQADRAKLISYYRRVKFVPILRDGLMARPLRRLGRVTF